MDSLQLNITRKNVLGWILFLRRINYFNDDERNRKLDWYLNRTDPATRDKELDMIFGRIDDG